MTLLLLITIIVIGITSIYLSLNFFENILSPFTAFTIPYVLSMSMYLFNFNDYFTIEWGSFFLIICVLLIFNFTQMIVFFKMKKNIQLSIPISEIEQLQRIMKIVIVLGLISTFVQISLLSFRTGISIVDLYSKMPGYVEENIRISVFSQVSLLGLPASAVLFACILNAKNRSKKITSYFLIIVQVISTLYANQKGLTIINIVWIIFIYFLHSSGKKKILVGILSGFSIVGVFFLTYGFYNLAVAGTFLSGHVNPFDRFVKYFSGGIGGLVYVIDNNIRSEGTLINLYPIMKIFSPSMSAPYEGFYNVGNMTTNISGLLGTFYLDFGFIGVLIFIILLFFISFIVVRLFMERGSLFSMLLYSYYLTHLSLAFFGNFSIYTFNMYIIAFLFSLIIIKNIKLRRN